MYQSVLDFLNSFAHVCVLTCLHMSHNPGDWHTALRWGLGEIHCRSATFISLKKQTERTYVAVFSILHKIKRDFACAQGTAASLNEESAVEEIQRGNFTPA